MRLYCSWFGIVVLAVIMSASPTYAEDAPWKAVSEVPSNTPAARLEAPVPLTTGSAASLATTIPAFAETENTVQQVGYQTVVPANLPPNMGHEKPEIIAVSVPAAKSASANSDDLGDSSESLFAVDRPLRRLTPVSATKAGFAPSATSASSIPNTLPPAAEWDSSADTSWGFGAQDATIVDDVDSPFGTPYNRPGSRVYTTAEYLLWWLQGQATPVLASTGTTTGFGILGAPGTQVLFGGNSLGSGPYSGGRFTLGYWLNDERTKAVEVTGFFLGQLSSSFSTNSSEHPVIARPFLNANNGQELVQLTSVPGEGSGTLSVNAPTSLWGLEGNLLCLWCCGCNYRIMPLIGFRNINLDESLTVTENIQSLPTAPPPFTNQTITVTDTFNTQNHFYGGQVGLAAWWYWGRWSIQSRGKLAMGDTVQLLDISGSQRFVSPTGAVQNFTGGLLALNSNIGHYSHNAFSVIPEVGINLGYQILPNLRAFVGYNFLYWTNVIRPGTSIDRALDVTRIPNFPLNPEPAPLPGLHPAPVFHEVGLWAQGLTFGLQYNY
jgi:hypothetical protein